MAARHFLWVKIHAPCPINGLDGFVRVVYLVYFLRPRIYDFLEFLVQIKWTSKRRVYPQLTFQICIVFLKKWTSNTNRPSEETNSVGSCLFRQNLLYSSTNFKRQEMIYSRTEGVYGSGCKDLWLRIKIGYMTSSKLKKQTLPCYEHQAYAILRIMMAEGDKQQIEIVLDLNENVRNSEICVLALHIKINSIKIQFSIYGRTMGQWKVALNIYRVIYVCLFYSCSHFVWKKQRNSTWRCNLILVLYTHTYLTLFRDSCRQILNPLQTLSVLVSVCAVRNTWKQHPLHCYTCICPEQVEMSPHKLGTCAMRSAVTVTLTVLVITSQYNFSVLANDGEVIYVSEFRQMGVHSGR